MPPPTDRFRALDDPDELAEVARLRPDGRRESILRIDGVHCAACSIAIEGALTDCVDEVEVNIGSRRARIAWEPGAQSLADALRRIASLGYEPRPVPLDALDQVDPRRRRKVLWQMLVALFCMMQVMMYAVPRYLAGDDMPADIHRLLLWGEAMLTVPVLLFAAGPFFASAWRDLRRRRIGMDTPVALGIAVTFGASLAAFLGVGSDAAAGYPAYVYFDSVSMFVGLLLVARWLESRARERAFGGLADSLARLPQLVTRLGRDGSHEAVSRRRLARGDRILVPVGAAIGADGRIASGRSSVDESLITGESRPLPREPGDPVVGGSLNLTQPIEVEVTAVAGESRLAQLHQLVERAAASKPTLLRTADAFAGPFLVAVLLAAAATWLGWHFVDPVRAPWIAASVLIVTCPCAFALAAPSALLAAMGSLARQGVLIERSDTLETLAKSDTVVFDKTGTLTNDRLGIHCVALDGLQADRALAIAAALERASLHPVARAMVDAATAASLVLPETRSACEIAGGGVRGDVRGDGRWLAASVRPDGDAIVLRVAATAGVAPAGATFRLDETLRPDAREALAHLRSQALACRIASGDAPDRVAPVALACGVDEHEAACTPERKLALVRELQAGGARVVMVGDGVNDAAVLGQADASVSFLHAAPLAQHQAGVLLLGASLSSIPLAVDTARRALRIVHQSLQFSIVYNAIGIPLAIAGLLPPWLAGLGMAASSLIVVLNALRAQARALRPAPRADAAPAVPASAAAA
ncbi:MAG: heavy metal translocating P-type ATPase [Lautropia sp.]